MQLHAAARIIDQQHSAARSSTQRLMRGNTAELHTAACSIMRQHASTCSSTQRHSAARSGRQQHTAANSSTQQQDSYFHDIGIETMTDANTRTFGISPCSEVFWPKARCAEHAVLETTVKRGTPALRRGRQLMV